ncbi:anti-sigma factor [Blastococcus sp. CT_GayMR19]|nr:anti-sigma factor [Blastococcus sp. CT_GayMR19]
MPDHETLDELAVGWALHALEPEDEAVFALHLPGCARCSATVAETTEVMGSMALDLPQAEPSQDLRSRLLAAVETTEQLPAQAVPAAPSQGAPSGAQEPAPVRSLHPRGERSRWRRALPASLVAAAIAAIVGLGLWNVFLASSQERLEETVASQEEVMAVLLSPGQATIAPLQQVDPKGGTVATVVARDDELQVVTNGLSVNDADATTYVVWGMGEGSPTPLGTFDVTRSQMDVRPVGSRSTDLDGFSMYGISLEPGQEAPPEPTVVVATGEVAS